jgi:hypothetical protein
VFPAADPEAGFIGFVTIRSSVEVADDGLGFLGHVHHARGVARGLVMTLGSPF